MGTLNERSGEYRLAREKTRKKIIAVITVILAVLFFAYIIWFIWNGVRNKEYHGYNTVKSYDRTDSNTVTYMNYGDNILKYSRDGAMAMDADGNTLWNGSFEMQNPMVDCRGSYVAAANTGGREVYGYIGEDSGTVIDVPLPVQAVRVAAQGVVAVLLEDENSNSINLYNPYDSSNKLLVEVPTNVKTDGYPVDIALSPDGQSLVTTYLTVNGGATESRVCFYNFSEVGQDKNRIVGGKTYDSSLVSKIEFVNDDTVCVFLDNGFTLFRNMKQPAEIYSEEFESEIKSVVYDEGYVGYIFEQGDGDGKYSLKLYDADGKVILDSGIDYEYESVYLDGPEVIFMSAKGCNIIKTNGVCKLRCDFDTGVRYLFGTGKDDTYFMIDDRMINIVELTEDDV